MMLARGRAAATTVPRGHPRALLPPLLLRRRVARAAASRRESDEGPLAPDPGADAFSLETTHVVLRSVTARAVQRVLARLSTVDRASYRWLAAFARSHPPLEGGAFVARLLAEPPVAVDEDEDGGATTAGGGGGGGAGVGGASSVRRPPGHNGQQQRVVHPAQLASAVLVTRAELARDVARSLEDCAAREGVAVLREHLKAHTYTTSTKEAPRARYSVGRGGAGAAASGSVALWRELRRREGGSGGGGGAGEGLGGR